MRMSTQASGYSCPDSMEFEFYEAFPEGLNMQMCMAETDSLSEFSSIEDPYGSSSTTFVSSDVFASAYNMFTSDDLHSYSEELCQYSDTLSVNDKVVDVCDWINEIFQDIPFADQDFQVEGSSSPSVQSNCSWVDHTPFQQQLVKEAQMSPSTNSSITSANQMLKQSPRPLRGDLLDVDDRSGLPHLLKAFGEATEDGSLALAEAISKRIREIVAPMGSIMERIGYYMFQGSENQNDYIRQESSKINMEAFHAFYNLCLSNRFAHFTANLTILSSMPGGTETLHIVDFDIREGSQWPSLIEAVGSHKLVRITALRWIETHYKFEETKNHLLKYAESRGLRLVVDEMDMEEICLEKKRMKKRGGKELLVFNCAVGLPCMGTQRSFRQANDFLKVSKEIIGTANRGIITFANGCIQEIGVQRDDGFASYFDECLLRAYALFESIEWHIPPHLVGARSAIECLFLASPFSSYASLANWKESREAFDVFPAMMKGHRLNEETVDLAMEMVKGHGLYEVRRQGDNELIMEWRGATLVKFSCWR